MIYRKWDLIEFSATPTPGNSDCLTMLVSRGLITAPEGFVPSSPSPELYGGPAGGAMSRQLLLETPEDLARYYLYVEQVGNDWAVFEPSGKKIASFRSADDANELIRAMGSTRSFENVLTALHASQQSRFEQRKEDLLAEIMLRKWGVI